MLLVLISPFLKRRRIRKPAEPFVSVILSAFNEEKSIEQKLLNLLELDYPEEKLEILIGSDGGSDATDEIVSRFSSPRVRFFRFVKNFGKPSVLASLIHEARGSILVFTDARQELDPRSVRALVENFGDPEIGCVSGELYFRTPHKSHHDENRYPREVGIQPRIGAPRQRPFSNQKVLLGTPKTQTSNSVGSIGKGMGAYWEYEKFLRKKESEVGSMLGATGALYAIRKRLFSGLPLDTLVDDMYIPLSIIEKGYRVVFEPRAIAYDRVSMRGQEEFTRKVRTLAGNYQIFVRFPHLLVPFKSPIAWKLFSHKLLRLPAPFFLIGLLVSSLFLISAKFYAGFLAAQVIFYGMALWEWEALRNHRSPLQKGVGYLPYTFCLLNCSAVMGLIKFIQGISPRRGWEKAYA